MSKAANTEYARDILTIAKRANELSPEGAQTLTDVFENLNEANIEGISASLPNGEEQNFILRVNEAQLNLSLLNTGVRIECDNNATLWKKLEASPEKVSQKILTMEMSMRDGSTIHRSDPWPFPGKSWLEAHFSDSNATSAVQTVIGTFIALHGQDAAMQCQAKPALQAQIK